MQVDSLEDERNASKWKQKTSKEHFLILDLVDIKLLDLERRKLEGFFEKWRLLLFILSDRIQDPEKLVLVMGDLLVHSTLKKLLHTSASHLFSHVKWKVVLKDSLIPSEHNYYLWFPTNCMTYLYNDLGRKNFQDHNSLPSSLYLSTAILRASEYSTSDEQ